VVSERAAAPRRTATRDAPRALRHEDKRSCAPSEGTRTTASTGMRRGGAADGERSCGATPQTTAEIKEQADVAP
jgi:hypothetical protein